MNEHCEGHSCVVFHHHGLAARREGAGELGEDFESVECIRAPHFDKFSELGYVPVIEMLKDGWWFECVHCGRRITDEDDEVPLDSVVTTKNSAFCNQSCVDGHHKEIADHNVNFESLKTKVQQLRPDLQFTKFIGEWPQLTFVASFSFEGCQYGGSVRKDHNKDDIEWYVANGDKEAWSAYNAAKQQGGDV